MKTFSVLLNNGYTIKIICESYNHNKNNGTYEFIISADKIKNISDSTKLAASKRLTKPKLL
ncbi:MAG: hypothetical protein DRI84_05005 [Bacteroidetes bacterium]|nr:MAG: hypothetical protein DRI84_05005 [Bacteroidota bacterium]